MENRDSELAALKRRIARLTAEARRNVQTWERSQRFELELLEVESLPALLDCLTGRLRRAFALQATSVAIADPDHQLRNLLHAVGDSADRLGNVHFVDSVDGFVPVLRGRVKPWLGALDAPLRESLFGPRKHLASVALLPMVRHRRLGGSLHLGSDDPGRFTAEHATDFLHHLACIAAVALESAVHRARLVQRGFTDVLTGWHNRAWLDSRLIEELVRSQREREALVCLMLDIDHFKRINDLHGHGAGDAVLREVATRVGAEVRRSDVSARYGGEEFVVLLPRTGLETGRLLAERIRDAVSSRPFGSGVLAKPLPVTVSIGLALYCPDGAWEEPESLGRLLLERADRALYEAKAAGRNAVAAAAA